MNRRDAALALVALSVAPNSLYAQQQARVWRIGFLAARSRSTRSNPDVYFDAFVQGMRELGYAEERNLVIEWRAADGDYERLPALADELVKLNLGVIVTHSTPATRALKRATKTVPIVFVSTNDPLGSGLVTHLARPEGNITGVSNMTGDVNRKQVELLKSMLPSLSRVALLQNPGTAANPTALDSLETAARPLGIKMVVVNAGTLEEIGRAFDAMARDRVGAVILASDAFYVGHWQQIAQITVRHRMPTINTIREYALAGGLMAYGPKLTEIYRRGAIYVDKILKGAKPSELPIEQPTQLELVINTRTAKAIGMTIPQSLLLRADQVIN